MSIKRIGTKWVLSKGYDQWKTEEDEPNGKYCELHQVYFYMRCWECGIDAFDRLSDEVNEKRQERRHDE